VKPFEIRFTKEALKDVKKLTPKLREKLKAILIHTVKFEPLSGKKLVGNSDGFYSIRLTYQDRIVYSIDEKARIITIHRARTHYGD
jgi:mRNA interferase RelE/StbE